SKKPQPSVLPTLYAHPIIASVISLRLLPFPEYDSVSSNSAASSSDLSVFICVYLWFHKCLLSMVSLFRLSHRRIRKSPSSRLSTQRPIALLQRNLHGSGPYVRAGSGPQVRQSRRGECRGYYRLGWRKR